MLELLRKYRVHLVIGLLLLAAFVIYSVNLRNKTHPNPVERVVLRTFAPIQRTVARANESLASVWEDYLSLVNVRKENHKLLELAKIQNSRILAANDVLLANERLKKLLSLKELVRSPSLAASVIGEDSTPWFKTILIDRGANDGLAEGMPVLAEAGVVGQVVKVAQNTSRVLLLTDQASAIAAIVQRSRARGVVKGKGSGICTMEFTVKEEDVKVGDIILTSGMGGIFPKGFPVGEVTMVKKGEYGIFQTIEVRPVVNLSRLEEVLVLLQKKLD